MKHAIVLLSLLWVSTTFAQHCEWCGSHMLMVEATYNQQVVNRLEITVQEVKGQSLEVQYLKGTATFTQNSYYTGDPVEKHLHRSNGYFEWASTHYTFITNSTIKNNYQHLVVKVEDVDGEQNGGQFATAYLEVPTSKFIALCAEARCLDKKDCLRDKTIRVSLEKKND